jgi:HEPN domain-containing protein
MNPLTLEWVAKAEGDRATAERELRATTDVNLDAVCFHSQQCVEKYLKARLQEASIVIPKTHDLIALLNLLLPVEPTWKRLRAGLQGLSTYAVVYRYPGIFANKRTAREALAQCKKIRLICRRSLGLPN